MGTITFTINQGTPAFSGTKTYNVSDADLTRFFNWAETYYSQPRPGFPSVVPVTTKSGAALAWAQDILLNYTLPKIISLEQNAAITALTPPTSIVAT